jgi:predicted nucleotidyltransferase
LTDNLIRQSLTTVPSFGRNRIFNRFPRCISNKYIFTKRKKEPVKKLSEIKSVLHAHADELRDRFKVKSLSVFGSYARNEQTERSDVDVLVEYIEPISLFWLVDTELYLDDLLGVKVDLIMKRSIRPEIREDVLREAVAV